MDHTKILLTGPAGSGKTHRILDEFVQALKSAPDPLAKDYFLILPSAEHVDRATSLVLQRGVSGFFYPRITTMTECMQSFFQQGEERAASGTLRFLTARTILEEQDFSYFREVREQPGFINSLLHFVTELREAMISPQAFRDRSHLLKRTEPDFSSKYEALASFYERYVQRLHEQGFFERQELLLKAIQSLALKASPEFLFQKIWLDGFFDFTPLQRECLRVLCLKSREVTVTLTKDVKDARSGLFEAAIETQKSLEAIGFQMQSQERQNFRTAVPALVQAEQYLFAEKKPAKKISPGREIRIFESVGTYGEVEMIAREIKRLTASGKIRLSDIAVLFRQIGPYELVLRSVFRRYGIPVEIHERQRLKLSPWVQAAVGFLKIFKDGWKRSDLFDFLKSSYVTRFGTSAKSFEEICAWEHKAVRHGIFGGRDSWKDFFLSLSKPSGDETENDSTSLCALWELLAKTEDAMRAADSYSVLRSLLWNALSDFGILTLASSDPSLGARDAVGIRSLERLLNEMHLTFSSQGQKAPGFENFTEHFLNLIDLDLYSLRDPEKNQVQVYDVSLARQKEYEVVFVAGLLERAFPLQIREDPILSDWERRLLNAHASEKLLERLSRQSIERYFFYLAVTRARSQLVLSYPRLDREGKEALPSFYVSELASIFSEPPSKDIQALSRPYPSLQDAMDASDFEIALVGSVWHAPESEEPLLDVLLRNHLQKEEARRRFQKAVYVPQARLQSEVIVRSGFFQGLCFSPTKLEEYAKCPFRYFANRILQIKDPAEDFNIRNKGSVLHQVLEVLLKGKLAGKALPQDQRLQEFIQHEMKTALKDYPLLYEKKYQYDLAVEEIRRMLSDFIPQELEKLETSALQPYKLEFSFGTPGKPDSQGLEVVLKDGRKMTIIGRIDRIDTDAARAFGLVMDYKRSARFEKSNLQFGTALQLPIYIRVAEQFLKLKPVGGELYSIRECKNSGFYHAENAGGLKELSSRSLQYSSKEFEAVLAQSFEFIDFFVTRLSQGNIEVRPRSCEDYCPFPAVCRIEKWRLEQMEDEIKKEDQKRNGLREVT